MKKIYKYKMYLEKRLKTGLTRKRETKLISRCGVCVLAFRCFAFFLMQRYKAGDAKFFSSAGSGERPCENWEPWFAWMAILSGSVWSDAVWIPVFQSKTACVNILKMLSFIARCLTGTGKMELWNAPVFLLFRQVGQNV